VGEVGGGGGGETGRTDFRFPVRTHTHTLACTQHFKIILNHLALYSACCWLPLATFRTLITQVRGTLLVAQFVEALRYKPEGRGFDSRWCHWNFLLTQFFRPHYGPGVDSASNTNEYQEYFLGVKAAGA